MNMEDGLTIQDVSELTGLSVHTLRYYEREGLLPQVARQSGGHRRYAKRDVDAIVFITRMRTTGMPIRRLREYMALGSEGEAAFARRRQILIEHRSQVRAQVAELERCLGVIDHKIDMFDSGKMCAPEGSEPERIAVASIEGHQ